VQFYRAWFFGIFAVSQQPAEREDPMYRDNTLYASHSDENRSWATSGEPADYTSREGALALKQKIEAYWRERGMDVMLSLHNVGFHPAIRAARFDVRSDMVNGMPRAALKAPSAKDSFAVSLVETDTDDLDVDDHFID
jgi:hypothetical protein